MKKSIIAVLLALTMLTGCHMAESGQTQDTGSTPPTTEPTEPQPTWQVQPVDRQILAKQYFVYSCDTGEFLIKAESEDTRIYPASVTKLFTAYIALQYLDASWPLTAADALDMVAAGSSVAEIRRGDALTVEQLVAGMLLPSGNDAAYILAEAAGRAMTGENGNYISVDDAVRRFVKEMNDQAKLLGMNNSNFANPDGIHSDNHYTTYGDLALLGTLVQGDPIIRKYASMPELTVELASRMPGTVSGEGTESEETGEDGTVTWKNTNELINPESPYYCAYATGLKTGQTPMAGSCLLSSFRYKGQTLIIGVFGCPEKDDRFPDTLQLLTQATQ